MDNQELLESELNLLIRKSHKSGLSFWDILRVFLTKINGLVLQADIEYYLKGGK